ncbi:hypothetical protein Pint_13202 [Pistacia integerrima]|uniref:Uncharacterized protein n=1 Tax=Pistacia integerrima TaxID=434235 RepID=A0ACC0Y534_9ROSI|nr:hypothetical protein Pint_13202 [Pistacia integerrima]
MIPVVRLPVELSSLDSMLPLHSATASARLRSSLSLESHCWGLVPQAYSYEKRQLWTGSWSASKMSKAQLWSMLFKLQEGTMKEPKILAKVVEWWD